jgi:hypothetical protein
LDEILTGRFTGLAGTYAKYRPSYPAQAIEYIWKRCGLGTDLLLVDVGFGTGISTRLFSWLCINVIGIEPMPRCAQPRQRPARVQRNGR